MGYNDTPMKGTIMDYITYADATETVATFTTLHICGCVVKCYVYLVGPPDTTEALCDTHK